MDGVSCFCSKQYLAKAVAVQCCSHRARSLHTKFEEERGINLSCEHPVLNQLTVLSYALHGQPGIRWKFIVFFLYLGVRSQLTLGNLPQ